MSAKYLSKKATKEMPVYLSNSEGELGTQSKNHKTYIKNVLYFNTKRIIIICVVKWIFRKIISIKNLLKTVKRTKIKKSKTDRHDDHSYLNNIKISFKKTSDSILCRTQTKKEWKKGQIKLLCTSLQITAK